MCRRGLRSKTAHAYVVRGMPLGITHASEYLAWRSEVAEYDAIKGDDGHEVWPSASETAWRNSFEYWLFCHWWIIAHSLGSNS